MNNLKGWLKAYGLNDTEIAVYVCILQTPEIKISEVQTQTSLVRTTIYHTVNQLKLHGLVSESRQNNVRSYRTTDITNFRNKIESTIANEQAKLDQLDAIQATLDTFLTEQPRTESFISRYEGVGPIKQAIELALRCETKRWHIIASRDNFLYHTSKSYQKYYLSERKRRGIIAKTLWEPVDEFKVSSLEDVFYRHPRKLPEEFRGSFTSLVIIYDNTTLIIDPHSQKTAHAINNPTSTQLLRMLHEHIWKRAGV